MFIIYSKLTQILPKDKIRQNEPMKQHTTFKAGGAADWFAEPSDECEMLAVITACREAGVDYFILGNGSNVLFADGGYRGVVISAKGLNSIEFGRSGAAVPTNSDYEIIAGAGVLLKDLSLFALSKGLTGLEFACGIPGTVGGAVCMNAGAYESQISEVFRRGRFYTAGASPHPTLGGAVIELGAEQMNFGYRTSKVQTGGLIVLQAVFALKQGENAAIQGKINDLTQRREDKQPLSDPSAGSTFKRPTGYFAGKLIMDSGLAGFSVGGAAVSKKHCGFVVNTGNATAADILAVIRHVQNVVFEKFGVMLETEVKIVGE